MVGGWRHRGAEDQLEEFSLEEFEGIQGRTDWWNVLAVHVAARTCEESSYTS